MTNKFNVLLACAANALMLEPSFAGSAGEHQTRFGTWAYFRASTGNPNFINGAIYSVVDTGNRAKDKYCNPITPDGQPAIETDDLKLLAGTQPDVATREWWVFQIKQMEEAGLDFVVLDTMGMNVMPVCQNISAHPDRNPANDPFQPDFAAKALTKVLSDPSVNSHLKVGLIIQGGPAYRAYNWDRLSRQSISPCPNPYGVFHDKTLLKNGTIIPVPITVENIDRYYYELSLKPFFDNFTNRSLWLTHNGKSVEEGGRPVVVVYPVNKSVHSGFQNSGVAWAAFKARFKRDYGVEPFLIMSKHWFDHGAGRDLAQVIDGMNEFVGEWISGKRNPPAPNSWDFNGYRMASISPGLNAEKGHWTGKFDDILGKRWQYVDGTEGPDESYFLEREFSRAMQIHPDLAIIGHLDGWGEGQQFTRMSNYLKKNPTGPNDYLPPDYYIRKVRQLIDSSRH